MTLEPVNPSPGLLQAMNGPTAPTVPAPEAAPPYRSTGQAVETPATEAEKTAEDWKAEAEELRADRDKIDRDFKSFQTGVTKQRERDQAVTDIKDDVSQLGVKFGSFMEMNERLMDAISSGDMSALPGQVKEITAKTATVAEGSRFQRMYDGLWNDVLRDVEAAGLELNTAEGLADFRAEWRSAMQSDDPQISTFMTLASQAKTVARDKILADKDAEIAEAKQKAQDELKATLEAKGVADVEIGITSSSGIPGIGALEPDAARAKIHKTRSLDDLKKAADEVNAQLKRDLAATT